MHRGRRFRHRGFSGGPAGLRRPRHAASGSWLERGGRAARRRPRPAKPAQAPHRTGLRRQGSHADPAARHRREQQPRARKGAGRRLGAHLAVTSSFNGTEIVIFGAVDNSQQPSAEAGYYDVVIVVEGVPRRWSRARTTWPACGSTPRRPPSTRCRATTPSPRRGRSRRSPRRSSGPRTASASSTCGVRRRSARRRRLSSEDLKEFREAVVRLKQKRGLYVSGPLQRGLHRAQPVPLHHRAAGQRDGRAVRRRASTCSARASCSASTPCA